MRGTFVPGAKLTLIWREGLYKDEQDTALALQRLAFQKGKQTNSADQANSDNGHNNVLRNKGF